MPDNTIKLILEGRDEDGRVDLALFLQELDALKSVLLAADHTVHQGRQSNIRYVVSDLSHSSPAMVAILPKYAGENAGEDRSGEVLDHLARTAEQVGSGRIPDNADRELLERLRILYDGGREKCRRATLVLRDQPFEMTERAALAAVQALGEEETELGSIEGALEKINIHGEARVFTIYPAIGPRQVRCVFPDDLRQRAIDSLGQRVSVSGLIKYRPLADFPHEIAVEEVEVLPADDGLPTFEEIRGIAGKSEKSAEEMIRELRDEWD